MATYYPATPFPPQFVNPDTGELLSGGTLEAQISGTSTPTPMYTDASGTSAGSVVTLNSGGYPEVSGSTQVLWLDRSIAYKFILKDASGVSKWTVPTFAALQEIIRESFITYEATVGLSQIGTLDLSDWEYAVFPFKDSAGDGKVSLRKVGSGAGLADSAGNIWRINEVHSIVTPQMFGAKGDGSTDDTTACQAALDSGNVIYVPPGTYLISTKLSIASGDKTVYGAGPSSVLKMADAGNMTSILVFASGCTSATAYNLKFDGNRANQTTPTFGGLLESQATEKTSFTGIHAIDSFTDGIDIRTNGEGYIEGCVIENCKLTGSKITDAKLSRIVNNTYKSNQTNINCLTRVTDVVISGNTIDGETASLTGIILTIDYTDLDSARRISVANNTITNCGNASSGAGINLVCDNAVKQLALSDLTSNVISNCRDGIIMSNVTSVTVTGGSIENSDIRGISISGCSDVTLEGVKLRNHDNHATLPHSIAIRDNASSGDSDNIKIIGGSIFNETQTNSPVGIYVQNANQTNVVAAFMSIAGCTTKASPHLHRAYGMVGYVSENYGSSQIDSGTTSTVVTHGVDYTPLAGQISVSFARDGVADYGRFWVDNITATTFQVNVTADPAANLHFGWRVGY